MKITKKTIKFIMVTLMSISVIDYAIASANRIQQPDYEHEEKLFQIAVAESIISEQSRKDYVYALQLQTQISQEEKQFIEKEEQSRKDSVYALQLQTQISQGEMQFIKKTEKSCKIYGYDLQPQEQILQAEGPSIKIGNIDQNFITYPQYDHDLGLYSLHALGLTGSGVKVAMLDVSRSLYAKFYADNNLFYKLLPNSTQFSDHSMRMALRIAGAISTIEDFPSIAPNVELFHVVTNKWNFSTGINQNSHYKEVSAHYLSGEKKIEIKIYNGIPEIAANRISSEPYFLLQDLILRDDEADKELADFFSECIEKKFLVINISRDLLFGPKTEEALYRFVGLGGIIVKAIGNDSFAWNQDGITKNPSEKLKIADYDVHLHKIIRNNHKLRNAFIFVGSLAPDMMSLNAASCLPGNYISDRTLFSCGSANISNSPTNVVESHGTSIAAATVTGVLALLKEACPGYSFPEIANALLKTTDPFAIGSSDNVYGRLNAHAALRFLDNK